MDRGHNIWKGNTNYTEIILIYRGQKFLTLEDKAQLSIMIWENLVRGSWTSKVEKLLMFKPEQQKILVIILCLLYESKNNNGFSV